VQKLALMSVLIATFWIPMAYAAKPNPKRALRRLHTGWAIFCVLYVLNLLYLVPRLH